MGFFFAQPYYDYLQHERKYSVHTCMAYRKDLEEFYEFTQKEFDETNVALISSEMVRTWVSFLINQKMEPVSVRRKLSSVRSFFRFLIKEKKISGNPVSNLPQLKLPKKLPSVIPVENLNDLLEVKFENLEYRDMLDYLCIAILYGTGFRRAELISIQDEDVDLENRLIKVLGKRNKERIVPITEELAGQIKVFREMKQRSDIHSAYLLTNEKGKKISISYIYGTVKKALTLQKINGKRSPHVLRHTYATRLLQNGAGLLSVKELLGHSSLASTQVYTHVNIEDLKKIYKKNHPKQ
ncbi:MAG: tyrosine-type recombinase/integrase [Flavobacteriales bacterium]|nr:tyrosine-type recombinase/integrase [Flavobacteriales bacterium]